MSKQSCGWWFETQSGSLWRHSNDNSSNYEEKYEFRFDVGDNMNDILVPTQSLVSSEQLTVFCFIYFPSDYFFPVYTITESIEDEPEDILGKWRHNY